MLCDQRMGDHTAKKSCQKVLTCDRQHLFHLRYTTEIYAEDVIDTESGALARVTAQAAQACARLGTSASVQKQVLGCMGNFKCTSSALLAFTRPWHQTTTAQVCAATRLRCFILSEVFAFSWKNRSPQHLQPCSPLAPIRDLSQPSMTPFRTKPLCFCPMETKMVGLEERTHVDLILLLRWDAAEWGQNPDSGAEKCCQPSLNFQFLKRYLKRSLSHLDMADIVSKNPT